jgi:hypothetical protein
MSERRVPILTYHSHRISGDTYATNDHEALRMDLRTLHRAGFRVVPLWWVVEWLLGERPDEAMARTVAITFDDGADFDFHDLPHPTCGPQRSFLNLLRDFRAEVGDAQPGLHATAFVIASPVVRAELDARCMVGRGWMSDGWWTEAARSGLIAIENHSWDHNHPMASRVCQREQRAGSFAWIATEDECDAEIAQAAAFIATRTGGGRRSSRIGERHGTIAAFGGGGGCVVRDASRWNVPRLVCGGDWSSAEQLAEVLHGAT